jgi:hypothetical protein
MLFTIFPKTKSTLPSAIKAANNRVLQSQKSGVRQSRAKVVIKNQNSLNC